MTQTEHAYPVPAVEAKIAGNMARGAELLRARDFAPVTALDPKLNPITWTALPDGDYSAFGLFDSRSKEMLRRLADVIFTWTQACEFEAWYALTHYPAHVTFAPAGMPKEVSEDEIRQRVRAVARHAKVRKWLAHLREHPITVEFDTLIVGAEFALNATRIPTAIGECRKELAEIYSSEGLVVKDMSSICHTSLARFKKFPPNETYDANVERLIDTVGTFNHNLKLTPLKLTLGGAWAGKGLMYENPDL